MLTLRREREEKADDSKRFELTEETAHLKSSRLIQVVHYMQEHVQEQIDMNTLCDVFYMSRSTLQHLFHKEFGCGPMEYFSRMKIRRAREMMREENCNITEIAARLSYGSAAYRQVLADNYKEAAFTGNTVRLRPYEVLIAEEA